MPPAPDPSSLKRKKPETDSTGLAGSDRKIFDIIKSKKDLGIWIGDIKREAKLIDPKLTDNVISKSIKSLSNRNLIKEVVNFQHKVKKHYMAAEFQPSTEISGGVWYEDGNLNKELINLLKRLCLRFITMQKVSTLERVHNDVKKSRALTFDIASQQVGEILNSMVLDNEIIEVKSTGHGDYHGIPVNTTCYRATTGAAGAAKGPIKGAFATIPCGACPRISLCTPDGVISPATCVYYNKCFQILALQHGLQVVHIIWVPQMSPAHSGKTHISKVSELQDPKLVNAYNHKLFETMVLAATLCIRHAPQSRPEMILVLKLLQGDPATVEWARQEAKICEDWDIINNRTFSY